MKHMDHIKKLKVPGNRFLTVLLMWCGWYTVHAAKGGMGCKEGGGGARES